MTNTDIKARAEKDEAIEAIKSCMCDMMNISIDFPDLSNYTIAVENALNKLKSQIELK